MASFFRNCKRITRNVTSVRASPSISNVSVQASLYSRTPSSFVSRSFACSTHSSKAVDLSGYGEHYFKGAVAAPYLTKHNLAANVLETNAWTKDTATADKVALAVLDWAKANGASVYAHWFQPLAASGVRHGQSAMVQHRMFEFDRSGQPVWDFRGKHLLYSETDGSSYPNGGLRATHRAGGYLCIDPSSPIFLRGDAIFIPACFFSYNGDALDEKTPLLRSNEALSREGTRLLNLLGYKCNQIEAQIGLEQEIFLIPRDAYLRRPDLQMAGRTVLGRAPARGQEMSDHYMAPLSFATSALACMQELQHKAFEMGIPLKTRHREVAPNQFEFAPLFGTVTTQIDQNVFVMQMIEEVAAKHGLAALLHEKPFQGINGSGKHNNWSLHSDTGGNLFNPSQATKDAGGNTDAFPVIMSAVISAFHQHADLLRLSIATPGNDFRLGGMEAPPSIMSMYLGEDMTKFMTNFIGGKKAEYSSDKVAVNLGVSSLPPVSVPAEDRNRTSPFPYGGNRFEFRAVGASQNVSLVNTILNTICAQSFKQFADAIQAGKKPVEVAQAALKDSFKCVFNGNGYDEANQHELRNVRKLYSLNNLEAIGRFTHEKNLKLFADTKVFSPEECQARQSILLGHYIGTVEIESNIMVDMLNQQILPALRKTNNAHTKKLEILLDGLQADIARAHHLTDLTEKAAAYRHIRLVSMAGVRAESDLAEATCPLDQWPIATYRDLLFLDSHA